MGPRCPHRDISQHRLPETRLDKGTPARTRDTASGPAALNSAPNESSRGRNERWSVSCALRDSGHSAVSRGKGLGKSRPGTRMSHARVPRPQVCQHTNTPRPHTLVHLHTDTSHPRTPICTPAQSTRVHVRTHATCVHETAPACLVVHTRHGIPSAHTPESHAHSHTRTRVPTL